MSCNNRDHVLDVRDLSYSYGNLRALQKVSFQISPGELKILLGTNGAGKTTLFSLLTRLATPKTGKIFLFGENLHKSPSAALSKIGIVFQQTTLDLDLTVRQNIFYHASLHGLSHTYTVNKMTNELKRLKMSDRSNERVRNLNNGHRRRVEIVRALLHEPSFLLLDEPTVGLDLLTRRDIVNHIHKLAYTDGIAVLWATHLIDEVKPGDSVMVMKKGIVQIDDSLEKILSETQTKDIGSAFEKLIDTEEP